MISSNISSTRPHNMVNFGPLASEIVSLVWGTPKNLLPLFADVFIPNTLRTKIKMGTANILLGTTG